MKWNETKRNEMIWNEIFSKMKINRCFQIIYTASLYEPLAKYVYKNRGNILNL